jgi:hypothetical protein
MSKFQSDFAVLCDYGTMEQHIFESSFDTEDTTEKVFEFYATILEHGLRQAPNTCLFPFLSIFSSYFFKAAPVGFYWN